MSEHLFPSEYFRFEEVGRHARRHALTHSQTQGQKNNSRARRSFRVRKKLGATGKHSTRNGERRQNEDRYHCICRFENNSTIIYTETSTPDARTKNENNKSSNKHKHKRKHKNNNNKNKNKNKNKDKRR